MMREGIVPIQVEALPIIIKDLKKHGYSFVTISDLMNKERDEIIVPVSSEGKQYLLYNKAVFSGAGYFKHILTTIFYIAIGLGIFSILILNLFCMEAEKKNATSHYSFVLSTFC